MPVDLVGAMWVANVDNGGSRFGIVGWGAGYNTVSACQYVRRLCPYGGRWDTGI